MILKNTKFKYTQAREKILDAILSGNLAPDSVLPSEQQLCAQLGVGRITLRAALHELEVTGIIIKQHGRQSRVNQAALRKQSAPLRHIAWVDTAQIGQTSQIYFDIFRSISEGAVTRNVKLDYISLTIDAMAENFFLKQQDYDGLILGEFRPCFRKYLQQINHPNCISVDCLRSGIPHCVKTDSFLGGKMAAQALIESGHRKPAFLGFSDTIRNYEPFRERFNGFSDALENAGIELPQERVLKISNAEEDEHISQFLEAHLPALKEADSLFVIADKTAVTALYALQKLGMCIPDDLSVISFDGLTLSQFVSPVLTTIRQPVEEIGRKALEIVLNPTESKSYPECILIKPEVQHGGTVLPRNNPCSVFNHKLTKIQKGKTT